MTTDRTLPEVALGRGARRSDRSDARRRRDTSGAPAGASSAQATAARLARPRGAALLTTPARAGVLIGVSAAVYAVSLAAVGGFQAQADAETSARNQAAMDAVLQVRAANDALEAAVKDADTRTRALGAQYTSVTQDMATYQDQLARLSALVAKVQGSAAALNGSVSLPTVTIHGAVGGGGGGVVTTTTASGKA